MKNNKPKTIYAIQCTATKRIYVGCCTDVEARIRQHFRDLSKGCKTMNTGKLQRGNTPWQDDFNAHGIDSFKAFIIRRDVPADQAEVLEREYILKYRANELEHVYNILPRFGPQVEIIEGEPPAMFTAQGSAPRDKTA